MEIEVEIAGVGMHPFGRFADKSVVDLGVHAVEAALKEAGVGRGGFQAAYCGTVYAGVAAGHKVLTPIIAIFLHPDERTGRCEPRSATRCRLRR